MLSETVFLFQILFSCKNAVSFLECIEDTNMLFEGTMCGKSLIESLLWRLRKVNYMFGKPTIFPNICIKIVILGKHISHGINDIFGTNKRLEKCENNWVCGCIVACQ